MSKHQKIEAFVDSLNLSDSSRDRRYAGYFACFNSGLYYEAHDVLEDLWLPARKGPNDLFYKGLIQLAGAFVHLQKGRLKPSDALFRLASENLARYPARHEGLAVNSVLLWVEEWRRTLAALEFTRNPLTESLLPAPQIHITD